MTVEKLGAIQMDLNSGLSIYRVALNHDVSEAAISYHIKKGNLKILSNNSLWWCDVVASLVRMWPAELSPPLQPA